MEVAAEVGAALAQLADKLQGTAWDRASINGVLKDVAKASGLKPPQLLMPLRAIVTGRTQTPSIDAVLELLGRDTVLARLARQLKGARG